MCLFVHRVNNIGVDSSPKAAARQPYRKAPAPPPPFPTNQHPASHQPTPAAKLAPSHQRSQSGTIETSGMTSHYERPSVPPPAPPKIPERPNVGNKADLPTSEKMNHADANRRPSGHVIGGLMHTSPVVLAPMGLSGDGTRSENLDSSTDSDVALRTQSANTSGMSDVAELSWASDQDLSRSTQSKEDIRKMTAQLAQLKAEWWHSSPTPGDRTSSKMSAEISGTFNPRTSPGQPRRDAVLDGKPENNISENGTCREKPQSEDPKSDDSDKNSVTEDRKSDVVDAGSGNFEDRLKTTDDKLEDVDGKRRSSDSVGRPCEERNHGSEKSKAESTVSKNITRTPPIASPRPSLAVSLDAEPLVAESSKSSELSALLCGNMTANMSSLPAPPAEWTDDKEPLGLAPLSVELPVSSPVSPPIPMRPKPVRSPPARPVPVTCPADVYSDACPPPLLPRKPSMDSKPVVPDSLAEFPTAPQQTDSQAKTRSLDRVRPEKPPPPLPRTSRSQISEPADVSDLGLDSSGDVAVSDEVAAHDEDTRL